MIRPRLIFRSAFVSTEGEQYVISKEFLMGRRFQGADAAGKRPVSPYLGSDPLAYLLCLLGKAQHPVDVSCRFDDPLRFDDDVSKCHRKDRRSVSVLRIRHQSRTASILWFFTLIAIISDISFAVIFLAEHCS